jgi:hypothetical protein
MNPMGSVVVSQPTVPGATAHDAEAWAAAINATAEHDGVAVTLLTLAVVDDLVRITGLIRAGDRSGLRLTSVPSLELVGLPDGAELRLLHARAQPHTAVTWASWTFERPTPVPSRLEARLAQLELEYRVGGTARIAVVGPWEFSFPVSRPAPADDATRDGDRIGRT